MSQASTDAGEVIADLNNLKKGTEKLYERDGDMWFFELWHTLAEAASALTVQEAEIKRLREANRKLHRRSQIAEAFMQSAEDIPNGWLRVLEANAKDIIARHIIGEIIKAKERARATLADTAGG